MNLHSWILHIHVTVAVLLEPNKAWANTSLPRRFICINPTIPQCRVLSSIIHHKAELSLQTCPCISPTLNFQSSTKGEFRPALALLPLYISDTTIRKLILVNQYFSLFLKKMNHTAIFHKDATQNSHNGFIFFPYLFFVFLYPFAGSYVCLVHIQICNTTIRETHLHNYF